MEDRDGSIGDIYITYKNAFLSNNLLLIRKSSAVWVRGFRQGLRRGVDYIGWPGSAHSWGGGISHLTGLLPGTFSESQQKHVCMSRK